MLRVGNTQNETTTVKTLQSGICTGKRHLTQHQTTTLIQSLISTLGQQNSLMYSSCTHTGISDSAHYCPTQFTAFSFKNARPLIHKQSRHRTLVLIGFNAHLSGSSKIPKFSRPSHFQKRFNDFPSVLKFNVGAGTYGLITFWFKSRRLAEMFVGWAIQALTAHRGYTVPVTVTIWLKCWY